MRFRATLAPLAVGRVTMVLAVDALSGLGESSPAPLRLEPAQAARAVALAPGDEHHGRVPLHCGRLRVHCLPFQ